MSMPSLPSFVRIFASALAAGVLAAPAFAQCANPGLPAAAVPGVVGTVRAMVPWDPDGPGPVNPVVVLAGDFTMAGDLASIDVATFDPATGSWSAMPGLSITNSTVHALAVLSTGELVAAGSLGSVGGVSLGNVVRWTGSTWATLGGGTNNTVFALQALPNGGLVAGGQFTTAGGNPANALAQWDGSAWAPIGGGVTGGPIRALARLANGELVVGGIDDFTAGSLAPGFLARWNGTAWSSFGTGVDGPVRALLAASNGDLLVAGSFLTAGGVSAPSVARWSGGSWTGFGVGPPGFELGAIAELPNGEVFVGGFASMARWTGAAWVQLATSLGSGGATPEVLAFLALPNGDLLAGGRLASVGGVPAANVARWNGAQWAALGNGLLAVVNAVAVRPNGDLVVSSVLAGPPSFWRFDGTAWAPFHTVAINSPTPRLAVAPGGDVVAAYSLVVPGGVTAHVVDRWNGSVWSPLGIGPNGPVNALWFDANGDLLVGGAFTSIGGIAANGIARWDGVAWSPYGTGIPSVVAITRMPNGELIAANFGQVYRWTGAIWGPVGWQINGVAALTTLPSGQLVVAGSFTTAGGVAANRVARWNGTIWQPLGTGLGGQVRALQVLPNGDLIAAGVFTSAGGAPANRIARWNGVQWLAMGPGPNDSILGMVQAPNGDLVVGGSFTAISGLATQGVARITTSCPATASSAGAGCVGSGGQNVLTATSLPWLRSTFLSSASGLPANAVAVSVLGIGTTSLPLPTLLPQGTPGCALLVTPDLLGAHAVLAGVATVSLPIPDSFALLGQTLHQQVVAVELDGLGNLAALTSTNSLTLTFGSF